MEPMPPHLLTDPTDALSSVPAAGSRRATPVVGHLRFYYGPMDCGKSTLALQVDHNQARQGRKGLLLVHHDRSGRPQITSRIGITRQALEVQADVDLRDRSREHAPRDRGDNHRARKSSCTRRSASCRTGPTCWRH